MLTIRTMSETLQDEDIRGILENRDESIRIETIEPLYYPYVMLMYSFQLKGKLSKLNRQMMCNVDLVCGRQAIGQGIPEFITIEVEDHQVLPASVSEEEFLPASRDYVFRLFLGKMKILQTPEIQLAATDYFHKLFYLVECLDQEDSPYHVLVDSMGGSLVLLD